MDEKKKKRVSGVGMGYCPFSQPESRYNALYRDTAGAPTTIRPSGACWGGHNTAETSHDTARIDHDTAGRVQGRAAARTCAAWMVGCVAIQSIVS